MRIVSLAVIIWLVVGALAAYQRDYFQRDNRDCAKAGTVVVTVLAGPLNYLGANPRVTGCDLPQPSR